jgi:hypothetical protein
MIPATVRAEEALGECQLLLTQSEPTRRRPGGRAPGRVNELGWTPEGRVVVVTPKAIGPAVPTPFAIGPARVRGVVRDERRAFRTDSVAIHAGLAGGVRITVDKTVGNIGRLTPVTGQYSATHEQKVSNRGESN